MDYIGATPMQNPIMGLLAERLKQAQEFAAKPFGYSNPPAEMLMNLLGIPAVQQTAERIAYGEPLTTGRGMTTRPRPEAVEAALTVAPVAGLLGSGANKAAMAAGRAGERYAERVVPQIMERGGLPAQLLQDLSQGSVSPLDVWHGSPHGPFTSFDRTKIGSGEGAQAYGYGHYTGEARGTGEEYRKMLSTKVDVDGKPLYDANKIVGSTGNSDLDDYLVANLGDVKATRKNLLDDIKYVAEGNPEAAQEMKKTLDALDNLKVEKKEAGYLYKIDLPDEAIANMLDWDKPLSKQPTVMKAIRSEAEQRVRDRKLGEIENEIRASLPKQEIGDNYMAMFNDSNVAINQDIQAKALSKLNKMDLTSLVDKELDTMKPVDMNWNMTGKEFYELLAKRSGGAPKASEIMQKQGVPGIRYLDQGSRTPGGSDTSNFVVFPGNEDLLRIMEINDKPIGGLLETAQQKAALVSPGVSIQGGDKPLRSAVVLIGDKVFFGNTHADAISQALKEGVIKKKAGKFIYPEGAEVDMDLFLTNEGQIIDRFQAYKMMDVGASESANEAGIMQKHAPSSMSIDEYMNQAKAIREQREKKSLLD